MHEDLDIPILRLLEDGPLTTERIAMRLREQGFPWYETRLRDVRKRLHWLADNRYVIRHRQEVRGNGTFMYVWESDSVWTDDPDVRTYG